MEHQWLRDAEAPQTQREGPQFVPSPQDALGAPKPKCGNRAKPKLLSGGLYVSRS